LKIDPKNIGLCAADASLCAKTFGGFLDFATTCRRDPRLSAALKIMRIAPHQGGSHNIPETPMVGAAGFFAGPCVATSVSNAPFRTPISEHAFRR
jgi:hypothetical protein